MSNVDADITDLIGHLLDGLYGHWDEGCVQHRIATEYMMKAFDRGFSLGMSASKAFDAIENKTEWDIK